MVTCDIIRLIKETILKELKVENDMDRLSKEFIEEQAEREANALLKQSYCVDYKSNRVRMQESYNEIEFERLFK